MTLVQFLALLTRWQEEQARMDRRSQQIVWALAEINRDPKQKPDHYTLDDFRLHTWSLVEKQPTPAHDAEQEGWHQIEIWQRAVASIYGAAAAKIHGMPES